MREKVFAILKVIGRIIKTTVVVGFFLFLGLASVRIVNQNVELQARLDAIQEQNLQNYNKNAAVYSQFLSALADLDAKQNTSNLLQVERLKIVISAIENLDTQIYNIRAKIEAQLKEVEQKAPVLETTAESKPSYNYLASMVVYLIEQHGESNMVSIGTGTVLKVTDTETFILTNKHVCDWAEGSTCYVSQDKKKYVIELVASPKIDHDMQIVKTSVIPGKIAVKGIRNVAQQDKVFMVGNNNGNRFLYSEGTVSGFDRRTGDLIVGMPSGPGNSGSGIFTQDGYLTGLLFAGQIFDLESTGGYSLDTAHGICVNATILKYFLSDYFNS